MRLAVDIVVIVVNVADQSLMITHATSPATAIDVTHHAALDIGIGTGRKAVQVFVTNSTYAKEVTHTTGRSCCIDIFIDSTAEQGNVSRAVDITGLIFLHISQSTAVCIVDHGGPLVDDDVGVVFLSRQQGCRLIVQLGSCADSAEVGGGVADIIVEAIIRLIIIAHSPCSLPIFCPFFFIGSLYFLDGLPFDYYVFPSICVLPIGINFPNPI